MTPIIKKIWGSGFLIVVIGNIIYSFMSQDIGIWIIFLGAIPAGMIILDKDPQLDKEELKNIFLK